MATYVLKINYKGSSGARSTFVGAMIILHSAMPSPVHICIAVSLTGRFFYQFEFYTLQALIARIIH